MKLGSKVVIATKNAKNAVSKKLASTKEKASAVAESVAVLEKAPVETKTQDTDETEPDAIKPAGESVPIRLLPAKPATEQDADRFHADVNHTGRFNRFDAMIQIER